jgi:hypothetical protein
MGGVGAEAGHCNQRTRVRHASRLLFRGAWCRHMHTFRLAPRGNPHGCALGGAV